MEVLKQHIICFNKGLQVIGKYEKVKSHVPSLSKTYSLLSDKHTETFIIFREGFQGGCWTLINFLTKFQGGRFFQSGQSLIFAKCIVRSNQRIHTVPGLRFANQSCRKLPPKTSLFQPPILFKFEIFCEHACCQGRHENHYQKNYFGPTSFGPFLQHSLFVFTKISTHPLYSTHPYYFP